MKAKNCGNCQYYRQPGFIPSMSAGMWCSNTSSEKGLMYVTAKDSCDKFVRRGKKAPLWMRLLNKVMR